MQSSSLRTLTLVVTVLLLGALGLVIWLVAQTNQPTTTRLPTPTPSPTQISAPTGAAAAEAMPEATSERVPREQLPEGGFAFPPLEGYTLSRTATSATLTGPAGGGALNPVFLLSGGPPSQFVAGDAQELDEIFAEFVDYFAAEDDFDAGPARAVTVDGVPGLTVDIVSRKPTDGFAGRIVMARPTAERLFVMVGVAPAEQWEADVAARYEELLAEIDLLDNGLLDDGEESAGDVVSVADDEPAAAAEVTATPPPPPVEATISGPTPLPTAPPTATPLPASLPLPTPPPVLAEELPTLALVNANFATEATLAGENLWAATEGGIVAWNRENGGFARFTALDGLRGNHFTAAATCPLPGLGIVFGGPSGLQVFDTRTGRWNSLNTGNSAMSFDDVSTLYCDVENGYLVVGYARHGLDVFDAATSEWTHLDRNDGLGTDVVEHVAVVGDREAYWVSSGIGLSVIREEGPFLFNAANSPLEVAPLHGLAVTPNGSVWLAGSDRLYRIDAGDEWTVYDDDALGDGFPTTTLAGLAATDGGVVWLVDEAAAVCRFDVLAETCVEVFAGEPGMASGPVTGITAGADESVFYTTDGSGVSGYDGQAWRIYDVPGEALLSNEVRALSRDRDGFLWVGTGGGLQQFNPAEPTIVRNYAFDGDLPLTSITAIAPATISGVWFGGENGAALFDDGEWRQFTNEDGLADNQVQALTSDRQRRTWIGTRAGLSIWNGEDFFNLTRENGLPSDNVTALLADDQGVWIGTSNGGLYEFVQNQLRVYNAGNAGLLSDTVTALARAADGSLYVGSERGLARFEDGRAARVEDLPAVPVRSLAVDEAGRIWVGTEGNGLYTYDGAAWQPVTAGLPSPTIAALLPDAYGALWVGGENGGLMRLVE